jgi:hypothetical protein
MRISEEQKKAAHGGKYIQPSRVGTKTIAGHFDPEVAERLKGLTRARGTTVQALLSEALGDLFEKHVAGTQPAKPEGKLISEEQKRAAKGAAYVPPSRVGKRALAGHFSEETLSEITMLAAIQVRTKQSLLDEALELLFEKHGADLAAVRRARLDRQP